MMFKTFRARRWLAAWLQAAVVIGLPFIRIRGESALRFDVPSLRLFFFGSVIWISEAYFFLLIFLLFFIGIMLATVLYGRIWCGWACPQTVLSDLTRLIMKLSDRLAGRTALSLVLSQSFVFLFSSIVSASLVWYFVSPYEMIPGIISRTLGPWTLGSWALFTVLIYLDLAFIQQKFCSFVCPYARLQSAFFDHKTLTIAFDDRRSDECMDCEACVRACPSEIDIRNGLQVECINCAECIDACADKTKGRSKRPLIRYLFGIGGEGAHRGARPRVIGLSVAFAALAMLFAFQVYVRVPVDFAIVQDESQPYHQSGIRSDMMNAYSMFIENRSLQPAEYLLSVSGVKDAELIIGNNPFLLPPNSVGKFRIYVLVKRRNLRDRTTSLRFTLENTRTPEIRISREALFMYPERTDKGREI
ncbi:MAG TPA: 4Fe-4S dicluster domain-containing protein [Nitrospirota bacterium]|nr:4Fe-4S dicluster domain-containing protein [Nitrospirota bacterium]